MSNVFLSTGPATGSSFGILGKLRAKSPFQIGCSDGIFAFRPMFSYGQRSKCADLLNSYHFVNKNGCSFMFYRGWKFRDPASVNRYRILGF